MTCPTVEWEIKKNIYRNSSECLLFLLSELPNCFTSLFSVIKKCSIINHPLEVSITRKQPFKGWSQDLDGTQDRI